MWSIDMLVHLRAFVMVAELESFSRAADELLIGQPLLSRRIKSLEAEIGGELFDRSRRQIVVTDLGRTLFDSARDLLARAELFEEFVRVSQDRDRLRLGLPPDGDPRTIARIVARAAEHGTRIDVVELAGLARDAAFKGGALDAVLQRKSADAAGFVVELGLASAQPFDVATGQMSAGQAVHLDHLRPRRGDPGPRRQLLVTAEDDRPIFRDILLRAATRAGLPSAQIETGLPGSSALVRVLAGSDVLLCARQYARRHALSWTSITGPAIVRTYQLAVVKSLEYDGAVSHLMTQLAPLLGAAVDASPASRRESQAADTAAHPLVEAWR